MHALAVIETLDDMSDAAKALCIDLIVPLSRSVTEELAGRMGGSRVVVFADVYIIVAAVVVIALGVIGASPCSIDMWVGAAIWAVKVTAMELKPKLASTEDTLLLTWEPYTC